MSTETYPTVNQIVPLYNVLLDHLSEKLVGYDYHEDMVAENGTVDSVCEDVLLGQVASRMKAKLTKYYDLTSDACTVATLLDPRQKAEYYEGGEESVKTITGVLKVVYDTDYRQFANELAPRADPSADTSSFRGKMFKRLKIDMSSQAMANEIDCVSG
jgi:hypothetical protein